MDSADRFWSKVDVRSDEECWEWNAGIYKDGYGSFKYNNKSLRAHRHSWYLENGKIPYKMQVLHTCDNRKCVNPNHLYIGTHQDNMNDMKSRGRSTRGKTKLSEDIVLSIRESGLTNDELSNKYCVSSSLISAIRVGRVWKSTGGTLKKVKSHGLSEADVIYIRDSISNTSELAEKFNLSNGTIRKIRTGDAYKNYSGRIHEKCYNKFSELDVIDIRSSNLSISELSEQHKCSNLDISRIQTGYCYKHHGGSIRDTIKKNKVSDSDVIEIRNSNLDRITLAEKYGVNPSQITRIQIGQTFKNVGGPIRKPMRYKRRNK